MATDPLVQTYIQIGPPVVMAAQFAAFAPRPTSKDFTFGEITRYFAQQTNQPIGEITEVSQQTFNGLQSVTLFRTVSVRWRIAGSLTDTKDMFGRITKPGIETANRAAIQNAMKVMPNIVNKLTNLRQLWQGF